MFSVGIQCPCPTTRISDCDYVTCCQELDSFVAFGFFSGRIQLYVEKSTSDGTQYVLSQSLLYHKASIAAIASHVMTIDGRPKRLFLSLDEDATLSQWNAEDCSCRAVLHLPERNLYRLSTVLGNFALVSGSSHNIYCVRITDMQLIRTWEGHSDWPIPFCDLMNFELFTCSPAGVVYQWKTNWRTLALNLEGEAMRLSLQDGENERVIDVRTFQHMKECYWLFVLTDGVCITNKQRMSDSLYYKLPFLVSCSVNEQGQLLLVSHEKCMRVEIDYPTLSIRHTESMDTLHPEGFFSLLQNELAVINYDKNILYICYPFSPKHSPTVVPSVEEQSTLFNNVYDLDDPISFVYTFQYDIFIAKVKSGLSQYALLDWLSSTEPKCLHTFHEIKECVTTMASFVTEEKSILLCAGTANGVVYFYEKRNDDWTLLARITTASLPIKRVMRLSSKQHRFLGYVLCMAFDGTVYAFNTNFKLAAFLSSDGNQVCRVYVPEGTDALVLAYENECMVEWQLFTGRHPLIAALPPHDKWKCLSFPHEHNPSRSLESGSYSWRGPNNTYALIDFHVLLQKEATATSAAVVQLMRTLPDFLTLLRSYVQSLAAATTNIGSQRQLSFAYPGPEGSLVFVHPNNEQLVFNHAFHTTRLKCVYEACVHASAITLPESLTEEFTYERTFSSLIDYYTHDIEVVANVAHKGFSALVHETPPSELDKLIHFYADLLIPSNTFSIVSQADSTKACRILAAIAVEIPDGLNLNLKKQIGDSVMDESMLDTIQDLKFVIFIICTHFALWTKWLDPARLVFALSKALSVYQQLTDDSKNSFLSTCFASVAKDCSLLVLACLVEQVRALSHEVNSSSSSKDREIAASSMEMTRLIATQYPLERDTFMPLLMNILSTVVQKTKSSELIKPTLQALTRTLPAVCIDSRNVRLAYVSNGVLCVYELDKGESEQCEQTVDFTVQVLSASATGNYYIGVSDHADKCAVWHYHVGKLSFIAGTGRSLTLKKTVSFEQDTDKQSPTVKWVDAKYAEIHFDRHKVIIQL
ncbi:WD repeat protein [Schizosaccharomyces japonicus yFS275]|uniref:WD repeat protein n=1 Tax=Schizosaccharomyces japonicus (strain yFS275 / FY16936) TaxID=402676 RepID=B6JW25_SCHJY|nr:WD repeat protein [Schizosaccharomyces japonicus yFS275]EEB05576.1 WD repeat protein [Schizosaccharomyces japonicus yFS275]